MSEISHPSNFGTSGSVRTGAKPHGPVRVAKRAVLALTLGAGLAAGAVYGYHYWTVGRFLETTDDAYLKADSTAVAPKVSGYIAKVLVSDNEKVAAGQILAL